MAINEKRYNNAHYRLRRGTVRGQGWRRENHSNISYRVANEMRNNGTRPSQKINGKWLKINNNQRRYVLEKCASSNVRNITTGIRGDVARKRLSLSKSCSNNLNAVFDASISNQNAKQRQIIISCSHAGVYKIKLK
jgi:hypothetical protein